MGNISLTVSSIFVKGLDSRVFYNPYQILAPAYPIHSIFNTGKIM